MHELHELRVYMIFVAMLACVLRIGMAFWPIVQETQLWKLMAFNVSCQFHAVSHLLSFWWS